MHIFLSAGEASGDIHASELITAIARRCPQARFSFLGGDLMAKAATTEPLIHYRDMAFMGFSEVIRHADKVLDNLKTAKEAVSRLRPDAVILVDYPSFNLKLAKHAHSLGIPVYYYISPKIWAWKQWRAKDIKKYCRIVLSILPFEVDFYRSHDMEVKYVGNPSLHEVDERLATLPSDEDFRKKWGLDAHKPILALVPGSRMGEIRTNLPIMLEVATRHTQRVQAVVAGAPGIEPQVYAQYTSLPVVHDATFELVARSRAALVTSGTATLEAALIGTPQVVCYRSNGSKIAYNIMKRVLHCPFVSLPNLIAGREVVKEMLLHLCTPDGIDAQLKPLLDENSPQRRAMLDAYADIRRQLGDSVAADEAAKLVLGDLSAYGKDD